MLISSGTADRFGFGRVSPGRVEGLVRASGGSPVRSTPARPSSPSCSAGPGDSGVTGGVGGQVAVVAASVATGASLWAGEAARIGMVGSSEPFSPPGRLTNGDPCGHGQPPLFDA